MPTEHNSNIIAFSGNTMVYESVKRFSVKGLNDLIRILMESVDDALFELSEKVENDRDRNMYFEAMREIRLKRKDILVKFDEEIQQNFNDLIVNKSGKNQAADPGELSLVDQGDLEDQLAIDNMVSKARPHFEDDLFAVVERFKVILHRKNIQDDQNPLDPRAICDSFHAASELLKTDIQVKLIFYKLFDKFVMSNLGHFYRELNDHFIQKGILPDFQASNERMKQTTKFMANRISRSYSEEQLDNSDYELTLEQQSIASDNKNQPQIDGNLLSMLQQVLTPGGNLPPMQTGSVENSMLPQQEQSSDSIPMVGLTPGAQNIAYMSALTNLQSANRFPQPPGTVDPQNLKTQLNQQLVDFKQDNGQHSSAADNQIIDIVSMLFDFFFDDEALPDPIKVLIGRLQIPILKVAIMDSGFFNHKKHPARQLLDSISKASLGWSADQQQEKILIQKLEQIVEFLLVEFDQDIVIFEQALDQFQQFLKDENSKIDQSVEELKQTEKKNDEKIKRAHEAASVFIQKLLDKHELSFDVIDFLGGTWKSVLYHIFLTQGESSSHWKNVKRLTTTLIWTLIAKHNVEDKQKLLKTLPSLLRALANGMELIKIDADGKNKVFQMLVLEHAKVVKQTSKNLVTRVDDQTVWPENNMEEAFSDFNESKQDDSSVDLLLTPDDTGEIQIIENEPEVDKTVDTVVEITVSETQEVIHNLQEFTDCVVNGNIYIEEEIIMDSTPGIDFMAEMDNDADDFLGTVQDMKPGAWVEFIESDSKSVNAKLSWKSKVTGKYVFVNRQGHKIKNMTSFGLAAEFRAGTAKLIESVSVFDRAINSFMSSIRH